MAAPKDNGGFLQVPTPGGLAPLQKQTLNPVPTGSATGKKNCPKYPKNQKCPHFFLKLPDIY